MYSQTKIVLNAADDLEASAFVFNSRMMGIDDKTIVNDLRRKGLSEPVIATAFEGAAAANVRVPWIADPPPADIELVSATLINEARLGKPLKDILLRMRATGLAARAAGKVSPFSSEALIAEAIRREQVKLIPADGSQPAQPPKKKSSKLLIGALLVLGVSGAVAGVVYWRRRRARTGVQPSTTSMKPTRPMRAPTPRLAKKAVV